MGKLDDVSSQSVSKHLEGCDHCQRRVAELSSDSFLGRLRDVQGRPGSDRPVVSSLAGMSMLEADSSMKAPPVSSTLPPGLANHPDFNRFDVSAKELVWDDPAAWLEGLVPSHGEEARNSLGRASLRASRHQEVARTEPRPPEFRSPFPWRGT
jgi:hypothetical protein